MCFLKNLIDPKKHIHGHSHPHKFASGNMLLGRKFVQYAITGHIANNFKKTRKLQSVVNAFKICSNALASQLPKLVMTRPKTLSEKFYMPQNFIINKQENNNQFIYNKQSMISILKYQSKFSSVGLIGMRNFSTYSPFLSQKFNDFSKIQENSDKNNFTHALNLVHDCLAMDTFKLDDLETVNSFGSQLSESTYSIDLESDVEFQEEFDLSCMENNHSAATFKL